MFIFYKEYTDILSRPDIVEGEAKQLEAWMNYYKLRANFLQKLN
ncbi:hypothetical protein PAAL109150_03465 [Paenibacillus alkaliterrae]|nr:hypothetical protein [Paenibacillus alkaliterrae]